MPRFVRINFHQFRNNVQFRHNSMFLGMVVEKQAITNARNKSRNTMNTDKLEQVYEKIYFSVACLNISKTFLAQFLRFNSV